MSDEFQEIIEFTPAYDRRDPDPKKNYGIHGVTLRMVLKGPEGAVQFSLFTNWQLPNVREEMDRTTIERIARAARPSRQVTKIKGVAPELIPVVLDHLERRVVPYEEGNMQLRCYHPMPADLGYHSPKPMYEGQLPMGAEKFDFEIQTMVQTGTFTPCELLENGPCYYEGSTHNAEPVYEVLLREGSAGVWRELREYYNQTFRDGERGSQI